jgi:hypothetical protein
LRTDLFDRTRKMQNGRNHYGLIACHVLWRELFYYTSRSPHIFHPHFLELGLHDNPDTLREQIQALINETDTAGYKAILLGYGLCGNGLLGIQAGRTPLVLMRGHDCITFLLGSKDTYAELTDRHVGTYWYAPGWIDNDRVPGMEQDAKFLADYTEKYGAEQAQRMLDVYSESFKEYTHAKFINQGLFDPVFYREYTKRNAEYLDLAFEEVEGRTDLLEDFIACNWDDERFLVVRPGRRIALSLDTGGKAGKVFKEE